ncbi:MAG: DUF637 domain-containing protein [Candidatus Dependentiae bacterium]|nr:DUF637 domain-containing protein [Candidatus Dependentiae bacterium]
MVTFKNWFFKKAFLSLVIASLFCGHISAMNNVAVEDEQQEDQQAYAQAAPERLLPELQVAQLIVPLVAISPNTFPLIFNQPQGIAVVHYQLDGTRVAQLTQTQDMLTFASQDPKKCNFLLQSSLKAGAFTVNTLGSFTFQKPAEAQSSALTCQSVKFQNTFAIAQNLHITADCCDNSSEVTCADILFKGNHFNALDKSKLNVQRSAELLPKKCLFSRGLISCAHSVIVDTPLFENRGTFKAGILYFDGGKILNISDMKVDDSFKIGLCDSFDHRGTMDVGNDCTFAKVGTFSTAKGSSWKVGGDWRAQIAQLNLTGNSVVGSSALIGVDSQVRLSAPFSAPVMQIDSKDSITCSLFAELLAIHHVGLKAKHWIEFEGDIFKTFSYLGAKPKPSPKLNALFKAFPCGVFLHSEDSGIKKSGTILSKKGTVRLDAKGVLTNTGKIGAGFGPDSVLVMNAESLLLDQKSILQASDARLSAHKAIEQRGLAEVQNLLSLQAQEVIQAGAVKAGNCAVKADNIVMTAKSGIVAKKDVVLEAKKDIALEGSVKAGNCAVKADSIAMPAKSELVAKKDVVLEAKKGLVVEGSVKASGHLDAKAQSMVFAKTSDVAVGSAELKAKEKIALASTFKAKENLAVQAEIVTVTKSGQVSAGSAQFKADETFHNKGTLDVVDHLAVRAKTAKNAGTMAMGSGHIKADRLWWNQAAGVVKAQRALTIDALASLNTLGLMQADDLTVNSLIDLNLLGVYRAKNTNINSIIGLNAGLYVPKFNSLSELVSFTNALKIGEMALNRFAPAAGLMYSFGKSAVGICRQGRAVYGQYQELSQLEDPGVSDFMPLLCGTKNLAMSAAQTGRMGQQLAQQAPEIAMQAGRFAGQVAQQTFSFGGQENSDSPAAQKAENVAPEATFAAMPKSNMTEDDCKYAKEGYLTSRADVTRAPEVELSRSEAFARNVKNAAVPVMMSLASVCGPQINRDVLLDLNLGIMLGVDGHSHSLYAMNCGVMGFANRYSADMCYGTNRGILVAPTVDVNATKTYANSGTVAGVNVNVNAKKEVKLEAGSALKGTRVGIETSSLKGVAGTSIAADNTHVKVAHLDNKGSTSGTLEVEHTGKAEDLKSFGSAEHLRLVRETIDTDLADALAGNKSDLGTVKPGGSIALIAKKGDVRLAEQHTMEHGFQVYALEGAITADKELTSKESVGLQARDNVTHKSLKAGKKVALHSAEGSVKAASTVKPEGDDKNFNDQLEQVTIVAGKGAAVYAAQNIEHDAVKMHSGKEGTVLVAGRHIVGTAIKCVRQLETHIDDKKEGFVANANSTDGRVAVCEYSSDAQTRAYAGGVCGFEGSTFNSRGGATRLHGTQATQVYATHETLESKLDYKQDGGWFGTSGDGKEVLSSVEARAATFAGGHKPLITSDGDITIALGAETAADSITLNAPLVKVLAVKTTKKHSYVHNTKNLVWWTQDYLEGKEPVVTASSYAGVVESNARVVHTQEAEGCAPIQFEMTDSHVQPIRELYKEVHKINAHFSQGPTKEATLVVVMAVSMATAGMGSAAGTGVASALGVKNTVGAAIISNMTSAAITSLAQQAAVLLLENKGDFVKAGKQLTSTKTFKNMMKAAAKAGVTAGFMGGLNAAGLPRVQDAHNMAEKCAIVGAREVSCAAINTGFDVAAGQDFEDSFSANFRGALANTGGAVIAGKIGDLYREDQITFVGHKVFHAALGGAQGAIRGGKEGAVAGALGAFVAETVADVLRPEAPSMDKVFELEEQLGRPLTKEEFHQSLNDQHAAYVKRLHATGDAAKIAAVTAALVAHQDVEIARDAAGIAIDHNFFQIPVLLAVGKGALDAAMYANIAYDVYNTYHTDGALKAFKMLGIEVITQAAGYKAGKYAFKFGGQIYTKANKALAAVYKIAPGFKGALGKQFTNTLVRTGEKAALNQAKQAALRKGGSQLQGHVFGQGIQTFAQSGVLAPLNKGAEKLVQKGAQVVGQGVAKKAMQEGAGAAIAKPLDYGHSVIQYELLKESLKREEFTSVVKVTKHGLERLMERFKPEELKALLMSPDFTKIQNNGAKAFIKQFGDRFSFVALNEKTGEVVTGLSNIDKQALLNLAKNYGWEL